MLSGHNKMKSLIQGPSDFLTPSLAGFESRILSGSFFIHSFLTAKQLFPGFFTFSMLF